MKKFLVVLAVAALTLAASMAFAAEVTVSGTIDIRSRAFNNTDFNDDVDDNKAYTDERVRLSIDAKADKAKAKVTIENDYDTWGRNETSMANNNLVDDSTTQATSGANSQLNLREAWIDMSLPGGLPGHLKGGHQLLMLGHGWWYRAMKYGADAWLLGFPGKNTLAFVDVKAGEYSYKTSDDTDAYVVLDKYKIDDNTIVGGDLTMVLDRDGKYLSIWPNATASLMNIGLNYDGKLGPVSLKGELDFQTGTIDYAASGASDTDIGGNQIVLQGSVPAGPTKINFTVAMGSGDDDTTNDANEAMVTILDKDLHYTLIYEYLVATAASSDADGDGDVDGVKNTGFANTTAISVGASYKMSDTLSLGADLWILQATEKVDLAGTIADADKSSDLGTEIDVKVNWTLAENLTWNWAVGYFMPGDAYGKELENATAIQGVLTMKF